MKKFLQDWFMLLGLLNLFYYVNDLNTTKKTTADLSNEPTNK